MEGGRSRARSRVSELVSAWIAGDYDTVSHGCTPDVRWWTPLSDEPVSGPADTLAELERVLEPVPRPIDVTAVVLDEDGTRCVVEMRAAAGEEDTPSLHHLGPDASGRSGRRPDAPTSPRGLSTTRPR